MITVGVILTTLTFIVVPSNMYTQWQISKGNLKLGYPLLMFVYVLYIIIETILAFNEPSQISILLFDLVNMWGFFMALKGFLRLRKAEKENESKLESGSKAQ